MVAMFRSIKYELYDMPHVTTLHVIVDDDMQQCNRGTQLAITNGPLDCMRLNAEAISTRRSNFESNFESFKLKLCFTLIFVYISINICVY